MAIKHRLNSAGVLFTTGEFDEVTRDHIDITRNVIYAEEIDEVTVIAVPMTLPRDLKILRVMGYFDEVTGITASSIPSSTYVTASSSAIDEGNVMAIIVHGLQPTSGTFYWTILNVSSSISSTSLDFKETSGSFTVTNGNGNFLIRPRIDNLSEGNETFKVQIRSGSVTGPVVTTSDIITVLDTSVTTPLVATASSSMDENSSMEFIVNGISVNGTYYWTITHGSTNDSDFAAVSGSFTITNGTGSFFITATNDFRTEGNETFEVIIHATSTSGPVVAYGSVVTVADTSTSISSDLTGTVITEGESLSTTLGVPTNIEYYWATTAGNSGAEDATSIAGDTSGNFYIVGRTNGVLPGDNDLEILKLSNKGGVLWQKRLGSPEGTERAQDVIVANGNIFVVGYSTETGQNNLLLIKYTSAGAVSWKKHILYKDTIGYSIATNDTTNLYCVGTIFETKHKLFLVKILQANSSIVWEYSYEIAGKSLIGQGSVCDSLGNLYVVGTAIDDGTNNENIFVAKFNSAGVIQWQKLISGANNDNGNSVSVDSSNNIFIVGTTNSHGTGLNDTIIIKCDSSGNVLWQKTLGGTGAENAVGVAVDSSGNSYLTGSTGDNLLMAKYDTSGTLLWQNTLSGMGITIGKSIVVNTAGSIVVASQTYNQATAYNILVTKFPGDGTLLGTYNITDTMGITKNAIYAASTLTSSTATLTVTDIVAPNYTLTSISEAPSAYWLTDGIAATKVYIDSSGYIYTGSTDFVVSKYSPTGVLIWKSALSRTYSDWAGNVSIVVDGSGNVYFSTSSFYSLYDDYHGWIYKLSSTGSIIWRKTIGSSYDSDYTSATLLLDNQGNVIYCVRYLKRYLILMKYNSAGTFISAKWIYNQDTVTTYFGPVIDVDNNIYFTGKTNGQTYGSNWLMYVMKVDSNFDKAWATTVGSPLVRPDLGWTNFYNSEEGVDIARDSFGNLYAIGNGTTAGPNGSAGLYIIKLDSSGSIIWRRIYVSGTPAGICTDTNGYIYAVSTGGYLIKLDSDGTLIWELKITTTATVTSIRYFDNSIYVVGSTFIAKFPTNGSMLGTYYSSSGSTYTITIPTGTFQVTPLVSAVGSVMTNYNSTSQAPVASGYTSTATITTTGANRLDVFNDLITTDVSLLKTGGLVINPVTGYLNDGTYYWTIKNYDTVNADFTAVSGSFTATNGVGSFTVQSSFNFVPLGNRYFQTEVRTGSITGPIISTSQLITLSDTVIVPTITVDLSINEGETIPVNITYIGPNATYYWTILHDTTTTSDLLASSGSFVVSDSRGTGSFTISSISDYLTEGVETFQIEIRSGSITGPVIVTSESIILTSTSSTPGVEISSDLITEGEPVTVSVNNAIPDGTLYWTILNDTTDQWDFDDVSGSFTVASGTGSFNIQVPVDYSIVEGNETFRVQIRSGSITGTVVATTDPITVIDNIIDTPIVGQVEYTTPGTYTWVCPPNVYRVSAVCVGPGGSGTNTYSNTNGKVGGGGGGLGWKNKIPVTPGQSYTVVVGDGGSGVASYFINTSIVCGYGGGNGSGGNGSGGSYIGDGGGVGGSGNAATFFNYNSSFIGGGGGGGAGGYSGKGGKAGVRKAGGPSTFEYAEKGSGGGGAGGYSDYYGGPYYFGGGSGGGGVGIYGEGLNGDVDTTSTFPNGPGGGGSGGTSGVAGPYSPGLGGLFGGGGGGYHSNQYSDKGIGGSGAVRLIWGPIRAFPSTNTQNMYPPSITGPLFVNEGESFTVTINLGSFRPEGTYNWSIEHVTTTAANFVASSGNVELTHDTNVFVTIQTVLLPPTDLLEEFYVKVTSPVNPTISVQTDHIYISTPSSVTGQATFTAPGTYTWTPPPGCTSISAVCVGGGGGWRRDYFVGQTYYVGSGGGGGGGLGWKNSIPVQPGTPYTVVVGARGATAISDQSVQVGDAAGTSYVITPTWVAGYGGKVASGNSSGAGGIYIGDGGGNGGPGWGTAADTYYFSGGGAGGYLGDGGSGGGGAGSPSGSNNGGGYAGFPPVTGSGGGAGGGRARQGGGVGIFGRGTDGYAWGRTYNYSWQQWVYYAGTAGSGGSGVVYGGGGTYTTENGQQGNYYPGTGAVRIIWGAGRAYPETLTIDQTPGNYWLAYSGQGTSIAKDSVHDSSGNAYIVGDLTVSGNLSDIFVAKLDSSSAIVWQRRLHSTSADVGNSIVLDTTGNVYIAGSTNGAGFVAKYNNSGTLIWQKILTDGNTNEFKKLATDSFNNVYVLGLSSASKYQILVKYNSAGVLQWQKKLTYGVLTSTDDFIGLSVSGSGNTYVCGTTTNGTTTNGFMIKYDSSGNISWQKSMTIWPRQLIVDASENIYITGSDTASGVYVAKYNINGELQWSTTNTQYFSTLGHDIALDYNNNLYILVRSPSQPASYNMSLLKFSPAGVMHWARYLAINHAAGNSLGYSISIDAYDNVYVSGKLTDSMLVLKVPNSGAKPQNFTLTGASAFWYNEISYTTFNYTYADSTSSYVNNTNNLTESAGTLTDVAGPLTLSNIAFSVTI